MTTLAEWLVDLIGRAEAGEAPDVQALSAQAEAMLAQAEEQAAYYNEPAPPDGEPVRSSLAEMAELLASVAELVGAYCETEDLELLRQALPKAQELCDIRDSLHYELQGESDRDSQMSSY